MAYSELTNPLVSVLPKVVTLKSNGKVRLFMDLSNECFKRDGHLLPAVDSQKIGKFQSVFETWSELGILVDKASVGIETTDNIHSIGPFRF